MRFKNLLIWDMRFQARYGFYLLYGFLTIFYMVVLFALPASVKSKVAAMLIFSDPAAMGLFFMGAIVLLEKSQRVTSFMAITPIKAFEYVGSKVLSLNAIALVVAAVLSIASGTKSIALALMGTFLAGSVFTLFGVIVATKTSSLNRFLLLTIPVEIFGFVPAIMHLFGLTGVYGGIYPANACMEMVSGSGISVPGLLLTLILIGFLTYAACCSVEKMWQEQGGVKL
jgi:fluoroquinolone transport system permease protein